MIVNSIASYLASIVAICVIISLCPHSYHRLMVAKYCNKQEKSQEAKKRSAVEWRPAHELERVMDMDLFLEMQSKLAQDSPHCLVLLHEMFCHAASKGQKEVE